MDLNKIQLNTIRLNQICVNAIGTCFKKAGKPIIPPTSSRPEGLIGQYKPYLNSNDSPTRDILKDYSGQGHDIQLYNFGWVEESGYSTTNYPGALVSDGVDDYGLCENFPILTKEKGYTVCAIREPIKNDKTCALLAHGINATSAKSVFIFEAFTTSGDLITSWGNANYTEITDNKFSFLKSDSYNNKLISKGNLTQSVDNRIALFSYTASGFSYLQKAALYALEIYDHDLTDEEIQIVKEAMISEYEKETGNILEGV